MPFGMSGAFLQGSRRQEIAATGENAMTNHWTLVFLLATILANFNPASVNSFEHRADAINKVAIVQAEHGK
jgi:hypothetical protein